MGYPDYEKNCRNCGEPRDQDNPGCHPIKEIKMVEKPMKYIVVSRQSHGQGGCRVQLAAVFSELKQAKDDAAKYKIENPTEHVWVAALSEEAILSSSVEFKAHD